MKKLAAILLSLMFVFALCACNNSDSSTTESSEPEGVVGKWTMESFESKTSIPEDQIDASIELNDDNTFTFTQEYTGGSEPMKMVVTGTYTYSEGDLEFTSKHATAYQGSKSQELNEADDFTGKLKDDKLTITNPKSEPHEYVMKRA